MCVRGLENVEKPVQSRSRCRRCRSSKKSGSSISELYNNLYASQMVAADQRAKMSPQRTISLVSRKSAWHISEKPTLVSGVAKENQLYTYILIKIIWTDWAYVVNWEISVSRVPPKTYDRLLGVLVLENLHLIFRIGTSGFLRVLGTVFVLRMSQRASY